MKTHRAGDDDFREFFQGATYFDRRAILHLADLDQLRRIVRVMIESANALRNERGKQFDFFIRPDSPMNSGRENDRDVRSRRSRGCS